MTDTSEIFAAGLRAPSSTVGIDTCLFQSADSYFAPASGRRDPRAHACFEAVVTPLCNNARLVVPVFGGTRVEEPPTLITWWGTNQETIRGRDWREATADTALAGTFASFVERAPKLVASWVSFQLSPGLRRQNFGDPEERDLDDVERTGARLIQEGSIPRFIGAIEEEIGRSVWDIPQRYDGDVDRLLLTAVAYALSVYVRAWSYAWSLGEHADDPFYRCAWIRESALNTDLPFPIERRPIPRPNWFPWGRVLTRVWGASIDDSARVNDALSSLRDGSAIFLRDYAELLREASKSTNDKTRADRDLLIAETLQRAGATPRLKRAEQIQRLLRRIGGLFGSSLLQDASGPGKPVLMVAEKVVALAPPSVIARAEGALRLKFRREKFWDVFEQQALDPIREWEREELSRLAKSA